MLELNLRKESRSLPVGDHGRTRKSASPELSLFERPQNAAMLSKLESQCYNDRLDTKIARNRDIPILSSKR